MDCWQMGLLGLAAAGVIALLVLPLLAVVLCGVGLVLSLWQDLVAQWRRRRMR